ncbi:MAG: hypothetical protein WA666_02135 [Nitrospirota bacterium]
MIYIVSFLTVFMLGANLSPNPGYLVPDISKAMLTLEENQVIGDKKPPTVINIRTYKNPDGSIFRTYSVGGHIFRYDVGVNGAPPFQYRLIDENGDGIFEKKEAMTGEMKIEGRTLNYFIDLGPAPGREYRYSYEKIERPGIRDQKKLLEGLPIYIPSWVLLRWDLLK